MSDWPKVIAERDGKTLRQTQPPNSYFVSKGQVAAELREAPEGRK